MRSNIPIVRQISWLSIIPQLIIISLLILAYYQAGPQEFVLYGVLTYVILSLVTRIVLARYHLIGMKRTKQEKFKEAIPYFEKSYDFFTRFAWMDKFRMLILFSSSRMGYREMALNNIAFCYSQLGEGLKTIEYYERTLREYPHNGLAKTTLKMIQSVRSVT